MVIKALEETKVTVTSVDAPSSWNIEDGPPKQGVGSSFMPTALVSLTAPKPLVKYFRGRHFVGGRYVPQRVSQCWALLTSLLCSFVSPSIAEKYDFEVPEYPGVDQVVEVPLATERL